MNIAENTPVLILDLLRAINYLGFHSSHSAAKALLGNEKYWQTYDSDLQDLNIYEQAVIHEWWLSTRQSLQLN